MLGKRSDQRGLFEAVHLYLDLAGRDSFYGRLAGLRGQMFRDEDFASLYCRDHGRSGVPPRLLATALLLQAHDMASDAEAHRRATVDLSWKVALGLEGSSLPSSQGLLPSPTIQGPPQLIKAVAAVPGNAPDAQGALELVAQSERHTGLPVTAAIADAAYGDGHTRQQFADAGRTLIAKVPKRPARTHFPKEDFQIDLAAGLLCHGHGTGPRAPSQSAPAESLAAGRQHVPAQCGFHTLSPPPPGRGAPLGPAGATGSAPGPVPGASQDRRPALSRR